MPISLTCPQCSSKLRMADDFAGKKIKCPKCAAVFPFPQSEKPAAAITAKAPSSAPAQGIQTSLDALEELGEVEELQEVEDLEEVEDLQEVEDLEEVPRARRRRNVRRDPAEDAISTLIPYKNGLALAAYYLGVFSLIPCLGLILGPVALLLGILGLRYVSAHPTAKGTGHAIAGIILGFLTTLLHLGAVGIFFAVGGLAALR